MLESITTIIMITSSHMNISAIYVKLQQLLAVSSELPSIKPWNWPLRAHNTDSSRTSAPELVNICKNKRYQHYYSKNHWYKFESIAIKQMNRWTSLCQSAGGAAFFQLTDNQPASTVSICSSYVYGTQIRQIRKTRLHCINNERGNHIWCLSTLD